MDFTKEKFPVNKKMTKEQKKKEKAISGSLFFLIITTLEPMTHNKYSTL